MSTIRPRKTDQTRLFPIIDRWFIALCAATILAAAIVILLPLAGPLVALTTPVRESRWRMTVLWIIAVLLTLMTLAPFLVQFFGLQLIQTDPPVQVTQP